MKLFSPLLKDKKSRNSVYLYSGHFTEYLISFLALPFISRAIGPEKLGLVGFTQLFGILMFLIIEFGSPLLAVREVVRKKFHKNELAIFVEKITSFKIFLIPLVFLISIATFFLVPKFQGYYEFLFFATLGAVFQGLTPTWYFEGLEKIKYQVLTKLFFRALFLLLIIYFVESEKDAVLVIIINSICSFFVFSLLFYKMKSELVRFSLININESIKIGKKSIQSFIISITPIIYQNISLALLSYLIDPARFGLLIGSIKIHTAFHNLYGPLSQVFYPYLNNLEYNENKNVNQNVFKYLIILLFIGLVIGLFLYSFSDWIISLLLGPNFFKSKTILQAYSIALPLTAISNALCRQWLMIKGYDYFYSIIQITGLIVSLFILIILVEKFGALSAPLSFISYESTLIFLTIIKMIRHKNVFKI